MEEDFDGATMDACLIAAGQRAEHYEMAAFGTLVAWARALGRDNAAELLQQILEEEKPADEKLSRLAEDGINQLAASEFSALDEGGRAWRASRRSRNGPAGSGARGAHTPAMMRSARRRLGERFRDRLRISSCCLRSTDSATTERAPPGPASRAIVVSRWRKRTARSRTRQS